MLSSHWCTGIICLTDSMSKNPAPSATSLAPPLLGAISFHQ